MRRHANAIAVQLVSALGDASQVEVLRAPQANSVLAVIPPKHGSACGLVVLLVLGLGLEREHVRWMTSFASSDADVSRFATGVRQISGHQPRGSKS